MIWIGIAILAMYIVVLGFGIAFIVSLYRERNK